MRLSEVLFAPNTTLQHNISSTTAPSQYLYTRDEAQPSVLNTAATTIETSYTLFSHAVPISGVVITSASMDSVVYATASINTESREIRLIEVLPGHVNSPVFCKFHRHALISPDLIKFRALSYTWGNPEPMSTIFVDNIAFKVRHNLLLFLQRYRLEGHESSGDQLIWIDALCIDQSNIAERNHQVALMREIYSLVNKIPLFLLGYSLIGTIRPSVSSSGLVLLPSRATQLSIEYERFQMGLKENPHD